MAEPTRAGAGAGAIASERGERYRPPQLEAFLSATSATSVKSVKLCVFTKNKAVRCEFSSSLGRLITASETLKLVMSSLGLPEEDAGAFSIWMVSKHLKLQLKPYHMPCKIFKRWRELLSQYTSATYEEVCSIADPCQVRLVLQRNVFYTVDQERRLTHPETIKLLYYEAVDNVLSGRYPDMDFHKLAGLQAVIEAAGDGQRDPSAYYPSHLQGRRFLSLDRGKHLREDFEAGVRLAHDLNRQEDVGQWRVEYLEMCRTKPFYGSAFFRGQIERPFRIKHVLTYSDQPVNVAINTDYLHVISIQGTPAVMLSLHFDQLSWELEPALEEGEHCFSSLWLEFDSGKSSTYRSRVGHAREEGGSEVCRRFQVFSRQAPLMNAMITRCVQSHDLREGHARGEGHAHGEMGLSKDETDAPDAQAGKLERRERQESSIRTQNLANCRVTTYASGGVAVTEGGPSLARLGRNKMKRAVLKMMAARAFANGEEPRRESGTEEAHTAPGATAVSSV